MAARHEKGGYYIKVSTYLRVWKQLSNNDVAVARDTVFQEVRPGAGVKTGNLVKVKLRVLW